MKKRNYLFALAVVWGLSMACEEQNEEPIPALTNESFTTQDFSFRDWGLARVEYLDPNDLLSTEPTHVNYALSIVNTGLRERVFGGRRFFELDTDIAVGEVNLLVVNLFAPVSALGLSAGENLLGGASERTFELRSLNNNPPGDADFFYLEASMIRESYVQSHVDRSFVFKEGTITISGTSPDFMVSFDAVMLDAVRNIEATFTGSTTGTFKIKEN